MSDTPETDSKASPHIGFYSCATVPASFARALEQERDKAREELATLCREKCRDQRERDEARQQYDDLATEHVLAVNKLAEERDQALMDRANGDMATMTINHYERLIKERDEARADAARIADILSGLELRTTEELARLEQERNEARAVADDLASVAAHCLGWHEHESSDAAIKIAAALKRWKKSK
jgi:hypothetical protein